MITSFKIKTIIAFGRIVLAKTTCLPEDRVDSVLSDLISKDKVRASISKKKSVIFGLRERVG